MKKFFSLIVVSILCLFLCVGISKIKNVKITEVASELYSQKDITMAINKIILRFALPISNSTLKEISYAGDALTLEHQEWAARYDADEVIVLDSEFFVKRTDGAETLNESCTYNWIWILVRTSAGKWKLVDYGFE